MRKGLVRKIANDRTALTLQLYTTGGYGEPGSEQADSIAITTLLPNRLEDQFCFCNEKGEWDNNFGNNYVFPIEKKQVELIVLDDEPVSLGNARKLRKSYIWSKKIRLAVYKIITYLPKLISGNYKKKASNEQ